MWNRRISKSLNFIEALYPVNEYISFVFVIIIIIIIFLIFREKKITFVILEQVMLRS